MARNKLGDLRDHLFETLEALKDKEAPMEIERARAVSEVAQTMINLAKVEVDLVRAAEGRAIEGVFFSVPEEQRDLPKIVPKITAPAPMRALAKGTGS